jgi:hypothetical protein
VSALVALGVLGTFFSTITLIPHVAHAVRTGVPGGSPIGWALSFGGSMVWGVYGIAAHDYIEAAPGLVTVPCGLLLAAWSIRTHLRRPAEGMTEGLVVGRSVSESLVPESLVPDGLVSESEVAHAAATIQAALEAGPATTDLVVAA